MSLFSRKRVDDERKRREAMLRGVYEDNLRLREPGYRPARHAPLLRRRSRLAVAAAAALLVGAAYLYGLVIGEPQQSPPGAAALAMTAAPQWERSDHLAPGSEAFARAALNAAGDVHPEARGAPAEPVMEASASDGAQPTVRQLYGLSARTIVIDAGHGGRDPGATGRAGFREKDITLDIARRLRDKLARNPQYTIHMVRESDVFIPLKARAAFANARETDLFISIHVNYLASTSKNAIETYYFGQYEDLRTRSLAQRENKDSAYTLSEFEELARDMQNTVKLQESKALAESIQASLLKNIRLQDRSVLDTGVKAAPFVVLLGVKAPSVLAEIGSLNSPEAERRLGEESYRDEIAAFLAAGISDYLNNRAIEGEIKHVKGKDGIAQR